jgi:hypothetical protein
MQQILIPIGIMVGLSILSWLVQQMKTASDKRQMQRDRERQRAAAAERAEQRQDRPERDRPAPMMSPPPPPAMRTGGSEVDRFMQEINRLRERSGAPPVAKAIPTARQTGKVIPTVAPVRKKQRLSEQTGPETFPVTTGQIATGQSLVPPPPAIPSRSREELPMATVVGIAPRIVSVPQTVAPVSPPVVTTAIKAKSAMVERKTAPGSPKGVQLMDLLKDKNSLAIAVLLQEVLGPPKCKRG